MAELAKTDRAPDDEPVGNDEEKILQQARKRFNRSATYESGIRKEAVDDLNFKKGNQWPADIRAERTTQKRPCLTVNKMKTFVHQVVNNQRQNRPSINITPVGDKSDPNTAKMLKGLIRQIERQSNAEIAYDTAFDGAVSNGWGYWRLLTEYEGDDSFDQVIRIKRIRNPFRVYIDPDAEEPDASDAKWCFISDLMTREEFKAEYPGKDPMNWDDAGMGDEFKDWITQTHVRVAEYFYFETTKKTLIALVDGHVGFKDELAPERLAQIKLDPSIVKNEREVQVQECCWDTITAHQILDHHDWAGKWIPVVRVIGDEVDVEGKVNFAGIIRDAKDSQRMYNFWVTAETELIALAPKAPWIMEEGQIEGHEQRWKEANVKSFPYLLYKGTSIGGKQAPAPQRQPFAGPPAAVIEAKIAAGQDMQATTGIRFDASKEERLSNESGRAMRELSRIGDLGSFHYIDNLARALKHTGRILIDLIPKIYDTPRILTILREDDSQEQIKLNPQQPTSYSKTQTPEGQSMGMFNPKVGEFEVVVEVGPSFDTKRQEASESMINFLKVVPNAQDKIADLIAKNMDWPGADVIAERLASTLPPQMLQAGADDFPPQAKALVQSLNAQLQKVSQEHQQALAMLGDKEKDRELAHEKIDKDFEAKLTAAVLAAESKMMGTLNGQFSNIEKMIGELQHQFEMKEAIDQATEKAATSQPS